MALSCFVMEGRRLFLDAPYAAVNREIYSRATNFSENEGSSCDIVNIATEALDILALAGV